MQQASDYISFKSPFQINRMRYSEYFVQNHFIIQPADSALKPGTPAKTRAIAAKAAFHCLSDVAWIE